MQAPATSLGHLVTVRTDHPFPRLAVPRPVDSRHSESQLRADLPTSRLISGLALALGSLAATWAGIALLALVAIL